MLISTEFRSAVALENRLGAGIDLLGKDLSRAGTPGLHLITGGKLPANVLAGLETSETPASAGEWIFGYAKDPVRVPLDAKAIAVTAKWTCKGSGAASSGAEELRHWWQKVGTDAYTLEPGLMRFEAYAVPGEDALIIHEVFDNTKELKFHLTKGTAAKYKKHLDAIATPENYYFAGPVSWMIRTYSKFMRLPDTYSTELIATNSFTGATQD